MCTWNLRTDLYYLGLSVYSNLGWLDVLCGFHVYMELRTSPLLLVYISFEYIQ